MSDTAKKLPLLALLACVVIRILGVVVSLTVLLAGPRSRAQYINMSAEIEFTQWGSRSANLGVRQVQCVVGTNDWQMKGDFVQDSQTTYWFTGTDIIEHSVVTRPPSDESLKSALASAGAEINRVTKSVDGNPGTLSACGPDGRRRDVGPDCLCALGRVAWLAFCSGPCLKREGRRIFPPSDLWKALVYAPTGFSDVTEVFDDELGVPESLNLYSPKNEPVLQYRVLASTNVAGWHFPLEFYLAQYRPAYLPNGRDFGTNGWELHITAKGKVTSIEVGTKPSRPPENLQE